MESGLIAKWFEVVDTRQQDMHLIGRELKIYYDWNPTQLSQMNSITSESTNVVYSLEISNNR